jgi:guanine deaminase
MCLAAIVWSGIRAVYYGCSADDTAAIGFADRAIYDLIRGHAGPGGPKLQSLLREECLPVFGAWTAVGGALRRVGT